MQPKRFCMLVGHCGIVKNPAMLMGQLPEIEIYSSSRFLDSRIEFGKFPEISKRMQSDEQSSGRSKPREARAYRAAFFWCADKYMPEFKRPSGSGQFAEFK